MKLPETVLAGGPWAGVALVHVTLVALLGFLAWVAARRGGPALRGAVLLATLLGLLVVPGLATVVPIWLPLPEWASLAGVRPAPSNPGDSIPALPPPLPADPAIITIQMTQPPAKALPNREGPMKQVGKTILPAVVTLPSPPEDIAPPEHPLAEPSHLSWPIAGVLAALWLLGTFVCLIRALARLVLLYRCSRRAHWVREQDWTDYAESLAKRYGLSAVTLRESPAVRSPLTLGLSWPVILLPTGRRNWSAGQRALILEHELAHILRRDFLTGLVAELVSCLCWFHPLVRWLTGQLRLEQEYAADAWVASVTTDSADYVRCLAWLALELSQEHTSLAPTFWRRRPEILWRIDMLRHIPSGQPPCLGKWAAWTVALLTAAACLAIAGVGPSRSAADSTSLAKAAAEASGKSGADLHGDPLPTGALARLGTTRWRHAADVTFVAFGPDGKTLITAGQDNTIRLWDLATGKEIRRFAPPKPADPKAKAGADEKDGIEALVQIMSRGGSDAGNFSVALAPDGKILATSRGNVIQLWDVKTGKKLHQIQGPSVGLSGLLFSPDSRTLAARGRNDTLFLWAADTGKEIHQINKPKPRQAGNAIVVNLAGGGGGDATAPRMAFTPDGKSLVAATIGSDEEGEIITSAVKFWDVASGKETRQIKAPKKARVSAVTLSPDGKILAFGGSGIHLCQADTGKEIRQIKTPDGNIVALTFSPDGKTLAARARNQRIRLWQTETGRELHQLGDAKLKRQVGGLSLSVAIFEAAGFIAPEARILAFSSDGKQIAAAAGSTVRLWDTITGKELSLLGGHREAASTITLSRDGKTAVSWGADHVIRRWEAGTGKSLSAFPAPPGTTLAVFSSEGRIVALANTDNTIRLHETATGKELHQLKGHPNGTAALAFASDGKVLASRGAGDNRIQLYDVAQGSELRQITLPSGEDNQLFDQIILIDGFVDSGGSKVELAFSPDSKLLVTSTPGRGAPRGGLVFFDVTTGKQIRKIEPSQAITGIAFSPDGRVLATENADRTITLWEVASGKKRGQLGKAAPTPRQPNNATMMMLGLVEDYSTAIGARNGAVALAFSPDGQALAARGTDRSVHIWDVIAGKKIGKLKGHEGRIETVAFAADGRSLASGSTDTTILLWDAAGLRKDLLKPRPVELSAIEVGALWGDLAGQDADKALRSILQLAGAPKQAIPFMGERLKPAVAIPRKISRWIADLESTKFAVRKDAAANLLKAGGQAVPALQKALASPPSLETRKRVEALLEQLLCGPLTAEQLRLMRAVEALERMDVPEARQLLRTLAQGAPGALPTQEAQAALDRLAKRPASSSAEARSPE